MQLKLPIHHVIHVPNSSPLEFFDNDKQYISPPEVCDVINNAAAGPWEEGAPAKEGKDGEKFLFLYHKLDEENEPCVFVVWRKIVDNSIWFVDSKDVFHSPDMFSRIQIFKKKEVTK